MKASGAFYPTLSGRRAGQRVSHAFPAKSLWGVKLLLAAAGLLFCFAASPFSPSAAHGGESGPFPHKAQLRHAEGFTLQYHDTHKKIQVLNPWRGARVTFTYILIPRGGTPPENIPSDAMVVEIPLERVVLGSTTVITFFPMLGVEDSLVGFSGLKLVNTPEVVELIGQGKIQEVSAAGEGMTRQLNLEMLFVLQPDLVMVHGTGIPQFDTHPKLLEAGFNTGVAGNYMESSPLGRAEWIKFVAAFFNKERKAEELFSRMEARYQAQAEAVRGLKERPTVFCGIPLQSTWYMPGGSGYIATFLRDAGADYLWSEDDTRGNMALSVENVLERAKDADVWINPGAAGTMDELLGVDERFSLFRAFQRGRVYNNNARISPGGGNDYWETGVGRPDLVLADLIRIFHPHLAPSHELHWHQRLPWQREKPRREKP